MAAVSQGLYGRRKGVGAVQYSTPEKWFGDGFSEHVYNREPAESYLIVLEHLIHLFPAVPVDSLKKFLK